MGLEPTSRTAYAPQAYMYTNSITPAQSQLDKTMDKSVSQEE